MNTAKEQLPARIFAGAVAGKGLDPEDALALAYLPAELLPDLFALAGTAFFAAGARRCTCSIINAKSGNCGEDCAFCAQSARRRERGPVQPLLSADELLRRAEAVAALGVDCCGIVTAGGGPNPRELERLCEAGRRIVERLDLRLCASFGILNEDQAVMLRQAGYAGCHHNLETSRDFYPQVCTSHTWEQRLETLGHAKRAGLLLCSGGIFGLGETWAQRIELLACLREQGVDSVPLNFLIPIPGTPLEQAPALQPAEALRLIALARLILPGQDIIVCGGRGQTLGQWADLVFQAGAGGIMVGDYLTVPGRSRERDAELLRLLGIR